MNPAELLPHKYPFLFIDRILEIEKGKRVVCLKETTIDEEFFEGHFKEAPEIPFTLIIEAMAQTSGLLLNSDINGPQKQGFLAAIRNAKLKRPVTAGEQMKITSVFIKGFSPLYVFNANASIDNDIVAEAEIILSDAGINNE